MHAKLTIGELVVWGDQWPLLVYANQEVTPEETVPGVLRIVPLVRIDQQWPLINLNQCASECSGADEKEN